jgi:hypothetical protein
MLQLRGRTGASAVETCHAAIGCEDVLLAVCEDVTLPQEQDLSRA